MYGVVMTDEDLSSYELKRLERIKENRALVSLLLLINNNNYYYYGFLNLTHNQLSQLFPEGTRLKSPRKKKPNIVCIWAGGAGRQMHGHPKVISLKIRPLHNNNNKLILQWVELICVGNFLLRWVIIDF